jgi:hypothetical protein
MARQHWYRWALSQIFRDLAKRCNGVVQGGPFRGMFYAIPTLTPTEVFRYGGVPKLLGCFEQELHSVIHEAIRRVYDTVINLGCAEGYYAVGLALSMPGVRVYASDIDSEMRQRCAELVAANGVEDRVTVIDGCTPERINELVNGRTLVLSDVEGAEDQLLRPDRAPQLRACDLIVELHDAMVPNISTEIVYRFSASHSLVHVSVQPRDPTAYPALASFGRRWQRLAVCEFRWAPDNWIVMQRVMTTGDRNAHV